jgi:hypothetical protein
MEGKLDIHGTGGNVLLSGREQDPFFKVTTREGTPLINMDIDNYYLQSAYFSNESQIRTTQDDLALEIYHEKPYIPVAIAKDIYEQELYKYFTFNGSEYVPASGEYDPGT